MQFGNVPFYSAPTIPFTDGDVTRLADMRFVNDRFVGDATVMSFAYTRSVEGSLLYMELGHQF